MKEFQIEKVESIICYDDNYLVAYYYPSQDCVKFISFFSAIYANLNSQYKTGMWRVKPTDK